MVRWLFAIVQHTNSYPDTLISADLRMDGQHLSAHLLLILRSWVRLAVVADYFDRNTDAAFHVNRALLAQTAAILTFVI